MLLLRISLILGLSFCSVGYASTSNSKSADTKTVLKERFESLKNYTPRQNEELNTIKPAKRKAAKLKRRSEKEKRKHWGIAVLLSLPIPFLLVAFFGAHRYYLGYIRAGIAQTSLLAVTILSFGTLVFTGGTLFNLLLLTGLVSAIVLAVWLLSDFFNILSGELKPKNGDYYKRSKNLSDPTDLTG